MKKGKASTTEQWRRPAIANNASYLEKPERQRYLSLSTKASRSKQEEDERWTLVRKAEANRKFARRFESMLPQIERAGAELQKTPNDSAVQREFLRTIIAACYPDLFTVEVELVAQGKHKPCSHTAARQGLEGVLYVMDNTVVGEVIGDLDRRLRFLSNLDAMLEPFRKLTAHNPDNGKPLDLNKAFGFAAKGSGNRSRDRLNVTSEDWGTPCLDMHLLCLTGVTRTEAKNRVKAAHSLPRDEATLLKEYYEWRKHPVRAEWLRRGDEGHAKKILARPPYQKLLATAFPPVTRY